ncbi:MAG: efflux RND transporter periplasmic adaptor subunit, partial [Bacteroidales bacterium]|nr:efflux RND transporter periplasmic adaptor subunit [Bacteroidales bacterium]
MNKKKTALLAVIVCLMALAFILLNRFLIPKSLEPGNYKTALVDFGPVAMSVPATGVINPENEVLLLSPASAILSRIHVAPGSRVAKGDMLLSLDSKAILQEIETLQDQLNIMENDLQKNRLNARSIRVDLDYNAEVKKLRISSLKTEIADQEQLLKVGGISPAMLEQTKQEL